MSEIPVIIVGAAGRDFHNFNVCLRNNARYRVVAFTAAQIPGIDDRRYPAVLSGDRYPQGIPIHPEEDLPELIRNNPGAEVVFSYSDVTHEHVLHLASIASAAGADFRLLGARKTMLAASIPVIAVCAVRTGCGKSQTSRYVAEQLRSAGKRVVALRHPMPYGDLSKQVVQRFASYEDLAQHDCTIEEREEYEAHIEAGIVVYAGVDYAKIVEAAQREADVLIWDGGNNDTPFVRPDLWITVVDPLRPGHELRYHPGETNLRAADVVVINKVSVATEEDVQAVERNTREANPSAVIVRANSQLSVDDPDALRGKRALAVDDGPTLTHGSMPFGAATTAAEQFGAQVVDPRPHAVGSIREVYQRYPHLGATLPAMGYSPEQIAELEQTINETPCDVVLYATPIDLGRLLKLSRPTVRVRYDLADTDAPTLAQQVERFIAQKLASG